MEDPIKEGKESPAYTDRGNKYLTFVLGGKEFGVEIFKVKEIIRIIPLTTVPGATPLIKGVINLRGRIIPVADLRLRFNMDDRPYSDRTCIIVVEIKKEDESVLIGMIVDSVSEVIRVPKTAIEEPSSFDFALKEDYILGLAKVEKGVKVLLNIEKVLDPDEIARIEEAV